ncbi:hypothetical protein RSW44_24910, partial [Escherichia coli]|uniref:hypothetical protein n=1 Tax=Escherichia coli TaxID=562 RepID=UPI0028E07D1E
GQNLLLMLVIVATAPSHEQGADGSVGPGGQAGQTRQEPPQNDSKKPNEYRFQVHESTVCDKILPIKSIVSMRGLGE